jgi:hypothetical protein
MAQGSYTEPPFDNLYIQFADADQQWGPLLFLRPKVQERFQLSRVVALALIVGITFGLLGSIFLAAAARASGKPPLGIYVFPLALTATYFCLCQLTFVPAWNRRAARLAKRFG